MTWQGQATRPNLPTQADWFRLSLAETIVWCTGLPIENNPHEGPEIVHRRALGRRAGELYRRAHLSNWPDFITKIQYWRAGRMFARAALHDIAPLHAQLRSPELQPQSFLPDPSRKKCSEIVRGVISRRAERLHPRKGSPAPSHSIADGRLLLFSPEETLTDGAACYSSKGFFDVDNVPPWDTWVAFHDQYVISWVPPQLVELANAGVDANPEQCILWA